MTTATLWDTLQDDSSTRRARPKHARKLALLTLLHGALNVAGVLSSALLARWQRARTALYVHGAFGCLTGAAWTIGLGWGLAALGLSLLIIEGLSGSGD